MDYYEVIKMIIMKFRVVMIVNENVLKSYVCCNYNYGK